MLSWIRKHRRKTAVIGIVPALLVVGVFAFMDAHIVPNSTTQPSTATISSPAAEAVTVFTSGYTETGTTSGWQFGTSSATVSVNVTNPGTNANPVMVDSITLSGFTSNQTGCNSTSLPGTFVVGAGSVTLPVVMATGTTIHDQFTITMVNTGQDQSACAGALPTFDFQAS